MHWFLKVIFGIKHYMFRTVPLSNIRSFSLYTQQTCMTYTITVCTVKTPWWWTEELSETSRVLFQIYIWEISASSWFYYKNLSRCTITWTSKMWPIFFFFFFFFFLSFNLLIGWQLSIWNCCKPFFSLLYNCQLVCFWRLAVSIVRFLLKFYIKTKDKSCFRLLTKIWPIGKIYFVTECV